MKNIKKIDGIADNKVQFLVKKIMEVIKEEYKGTPEFSFQKLNELKKCVNIKQVINFAMQFDLENLELLSSKIGFNFFEDKMKNESKKILALR